MLVSLYLQDEEEAGLLELLKSQICDNAALYAQKYDEEFQPYLPRFVTAIWNLLVTTGQEVKYDLVSKSTFCLSLLYFQLLESTNVSGCPCCRNSSLLESSAKSLEWTFLPSLGCIQPQQM